MQGTELYAVCTLIHSNLTMTLKGRDYHHNTYSIAEETEVWTGEVTCPGHC